MSPEYPERPVPAAAGVVFRGDDVLLVKRGHAPNRGRWSVPGGAVEDGETVEGAVAREVLEETSVRVRPIRVLAVVDLVERDDGGRIRFHYATVQVLCEYVEGEPMPDSDAENARWIPVRELHEYDVTETALRVIQAALKERGP